MAEEKDRTKEQTPSQDPLTSKSSAKDAVSDTSDPSNPFHLIKVMVGSVGRIPAGLVLLFALALSVAALSGLAMKFAQKEHVMGKTELRLTPEDAAGNMSVDPQAVAGIWVGATTNYVMSLSLAGDRFEWIVQNINTPYVHYFARGRWKLKGNVLVLKQQKDLGYPFDADNPEIRFMPIPMDNIELFVALGGNTGKQMTWTIPSSEYDQIDGLVEDLFDNAEQTNMNWKKR